MKKITTLIISFSFLNLSLLQSQTKHLWASAGYGGALGYGTILKADSSGNNFQAVASFNYSNGSYPQGKFIIAGDGKIYGATRRGSIANSCVIFKFDTTANIITKVYDFMSAPQYGAIPYSSLIMGDDCILYGMTFDGGANGDGVIYSYDISTNNYTDIYDFVDSTGRRPFGELLQLSNGILYGMAGYGGPTDGGALFSFDPVNNVYSVLHYFTFATGNNPAYGNLIQANNGKLYGMTYDGGTNGDGVIFSFDISTNIYSNLHDFDYSIDGSRPFGTLVQANNNKLYGMTITGGTGGEGALFSYDIVTGIRTVLVNFNGLNGANPQRGMTQCSNGKLFGTTMNGGLNGHGVIFSYDIINNTYTKVLDFDSTVTGAHPTCDIFESGVAPNPCALFIPEITNHNILFISPNPTTNNFTIIFPGSINKGSIEIYTALGKKIFTEDIFNVSQKEVRLKNVAGIYFVKVRDGEKEYCEKLVIK